MTYILLCIEMCARERLKRSGGSDNLRTETCHVEKCGTELYVDYPGLKTN